MWPDGLNTEIQKSFLATLKVKFNFFFCYIDKTCFAANTSTKCRISVSVLLRVLEVFCIHDYKYEST